VVGERETREGEWIEEGERIARGRKWFGGEAMDASQKWLASSGRFCGISSTTVFFLGIFLESGYF
jgi:hypothetical protein